MLTLSSPAYADQASDDSTAADAALIALHEVATGTNKYDEATKDGDAFGCRQAYNEIESASHYALVNMHAMSVEPSEAISDISAVLQLAPVSGAVCPDKKSDSFMFLIVSRAIFDLRFEDAMGAQNWFRVAGNGSIVAQNPVEFARSLKDQGYWSAELRPKDVTFLIVTNWTAELSSSKADDPAIQSSGSSLRAVEIDYSRNLSADTLQAYFYRTPDEAKAAIEASARGKIPNKMNATWARKLFRLRYLIPDVAPGYRLVYSVCRDTGKRDATGQSLCTNEDTHDWKDNSNQSYHYFIAFDSCNGAGDDLERHNPTDVTITGKNSLETDCVPAEPVADPRHQAYTLVVSLVPPGAPEDEAQYAQLRAAATNSAALFKSFSVCEAAVDNLYARMATDLGVDSDGYLLSDKSEEIQLYGECVHAY